MRSQMDVAGRVPRLRGRLAEAGCDALLVTRLVNIRYLTGFTGSAALLLVRPDDLLFVTDGRYRDQSALELGAAGVDAGREGGGQVGARHHVEVLSDASVVDAAQAPGQPGREHQPHGHRLAVAQVVVAGRLQGVGQRVPVVQDGP